RRGAAAGLAAMTGILAGCVPFAHRADSGCPEGKVAAVTAGPPVPTPEVNEALWVVDGAGALRAIDGRAGRITHTLNVGGVDPRPPPALAAADNRVWSYRLDRGDVTTIDPGAARTVGRAGVPVARPLINNRLLAAHGALWIAQPGKLTKVSP